MYSSSKLEVIDQDDSGKTPERPWILNYRQCRSHHKHTNKLSSKGYEAGLHDRLENIKQDKKPSLKATKDSHGYENNINKVRLTKISKHFHFLQSLSERRSVLLG